MQDVVKKLNNILISLKKMNSLMPQIPAIPQIKLPTLPSPGKSIKQKKMPGISPDSKKDPKKIAQQIKEGVITTKQSELLKISSNGQWTID